jgi:sugar/nucleoside kinase (ribokinase family)
MKLVVVGSIGLDTIQTPFGRRERVPGGSAIYFSFAAALHSPVGLVGVVGQDWPHEVTAAMQARGVDTTGLVEAEGRTFHWSGAYGYDLNERETLVTELNVFETFRPVLPDAWRSAEFLFLGNIHPELQERVLDQVPSAFVAMDTMNYWIEGTPDALRRVIRRVDCLVINDAEARQLTQESNIVAAAQAIRAMGPKHVVIKRGEYGCLLLSDDGFFYAPAFPIEDVVDPTGAGDSFAGGFVGWLASGDLRSPSIFREAVLVGSAMASFCVERFSVDRLREVTLSEVEQRVQAFQDLTAAPTRFVPRAPGTPDAG